MRLVEILTGLAAIGSIATFLGLKYAVQRTFRKLGRKAPEPVQGPVGPPGLIKTTKGEHLDRGSSSEERS